MNWRNHIIRCVLPIALLQINVAGASVDDFSIAIIAPALKTPNDDSVLRHAINETDEENLAFVVVNGIKSAMEVCSDSIYLDRKILLDTAKNGLIVSLTGADWTQCRNLAGRSDSGERLNRLRELFFAEDFSFGGTKIPLVRQSAAPKFRSYAENARWEVGPILFATINLPSENNHYLSAGGRNNEFEDRSVANLNWIQRLVSYANTHKLEGLVLFCEQNPIAIPKSSNQHDGFTEIRALLYRLASTFPGRILVVHAGVSPPTTGTPAGLEWKGNLGTLGVTSGWLRLKISPSAPALFSVISNDGNESQHTINKKTAALK